jgi:hypothetical protein
MLGDTVISISPDKKKRKIPAQTQNGEETAQGRVWIPKEISYPDRRR